MVPTFSLPSLETLLISFFIGTEKVLYFSVFSPRHSICPSNPYSTWAVLAYDPLKISKTKNGLSMNLSSQKHVSFVSIVCLFPCLVWVT